jgi:hypothetical protein
MSSIRHAHTEKDIKDFVKKHGIVIEYVPSSELKEYVGMNPEAGKKFGLKIPKNVIWIDKNLRGKEKLRTTKHELEEMFLMRERKMCYWDAHTIALKDETKK